MMIKAIFFDMDGTLLDSEKHWAQVPFDLFAHFGAPEDRATADWASTSFRATLHAYLARPDHKLQMAYEDMEKWCVDRMFGEVYLNDIPLKDGAMETLKAARATGLPLYLLSATRSDALEKTLVRTGIKEFFTIAVSTRGLKPDKHAPEFYQQFAQQQGYKTEECLVIEDALYAMKTAKEAGCQVWAMYDDKHIKDEPEIRAVADRYFENHQLLQAAIAQEFGK